MHTCDCGSDDWGLNRLATDDDEGKAEPGKPNPPPSPCPVAVKPEEETLPNMLPVPGGGGKVRFCCSPALGITTRHDMYRDKIGVVR